MGMNIFGLIALNTSYNKASFESEYDFETIETTTWGSVETGLRGGLDCIVIIEEGNNTLIYVTDPLFNPVNQRKAITSSESCLIFSLSETAMSFDFEFHQNGELVSRDMYDFKGEDLIIKGKNILELSKDSDMIYDGLIPYIYEHFNLDDVLPVDILKASEKVEILTEDDTDNEAVINTKKPSFFQKIFGKK